MKGSALHGVVFEHWRPETSWKVSTAMVQARISLPSRPWDESRQELEVVMLRLCSGDAGHQVAAGR